MIFHVLHCSFQNHWYFIRVVTKKYFSRITKNCSFALEPTYDQHSLNLAPFQKPSKTLIILHISPKRPPEGLIWANDVGMRLNQKWATSHPKEIIFPKEKPILSSTYMNLNRHTATPRENHYIFVWLSKTYKSIKIRCNFPLKWIMKSVLLQHGSNWASLWLFKRSNKTCGNTAPCILDPQNDIIQIL